MRIRMIAAALVVGGLAVAGAAPASAATPFAATAPPPTAAPLPVGPALAITTAASPVLTLPADDGLRDSTTVRIDSGAAGAVDLLAIAGKRTVHLADGVALRHSAGVWRASVRVRVTALPVGSWTLRARRTADHGVHAVAAAHLLVGSGRPVHVSLHPSATTLYPYRDGQRDSVSFAIAATDETGTAVPVSGSVRLVAGSRHRTRAIGASGAVTVPVTSLPLGGASATVSLTAPGGSAVRRLPLTLAPTAVGAAHLTASTPLVEPVLDGRLDSVALTASGTSSVGLASELRGAITISRGTRVVATFPLRDGTRTTVTWDGRVAGAVVPGTYTATLAYGGPEGDPTTRSRTLTVTADHLPYSAAQRFLTTATGAGNQQGLAVHGDTVYVGVDTRDGGNDGRIDLYSLATGAYLRSIGPLPIGHVAELDYSTTTGLLYAANGGGLASTDVYAIDPSSDPADPTAGKVVTTWDLATDSPNAMVAVDDANDRMLVFWGQPGAYRVTALSLDAPRDGSTLTPDTSTLATMPVSITGLPQGIALVDDEIWLWSSVTGANHIDRIPLTGTVLQGGSAAGISSAIPAGTPMSFDVATPGEGEGIATDSETDTIWVGAHTPGRVAQLVPVSAQ